MAQKKPFDPASFLNFTALVAIAKFYDTPLVKQSIQNGYYSAINLEQAQKTLLSLRSVCSQLGYGLTIPPIYDAEIFEKLIEQFRVARVSEGETKGILLVNHVQQSLQDNDVNKLYNAKAIIPSKETREPIPQVTPPKTDVPSMSPVSDQTSAQGTPPKGNKATLQSRPERVIVTKEEEPVSEEVKEEIKTEKPETTKKEQKQEQLQQTEQQQEQQPQQQTRSRRASRPPKPPTEQPGESPEKEEPKKEKERKPLLRPKGPGGGGLWNNPFTKKLGQLARSATRGLGNLARSVMPHITRALTGLARGLGNLLGNLGGRLASQLAGTAARSLIGLGGTIAGVGIGTIALWVIAIGAVVFTLWWLYDSTSECGQPGKVVATKTTEKEAYNEGENIQFVIAVTYSIKCPHAFADVDVRDPIPANTSFVEGSAKTATAQLFSGGPLIGSQTFYLPGPDGVLDGNTLTWRLSRIGPNKPTVLVFSVTPNQSDIWISNQATLGYRTYTSGFLSSTQTGAISDEPPNQETCKGQIPDWPAGYIFEHPTAGNFGDPSCSFSKNSLHELLKQADPANADYWFDVVVKKESGYNPNTWANPATVGTPDAEGAWGLFQMGRGKNGQHDHGDVAWQRQTSNAVTYNNYIADLGRPWCYWQAARERWPALCRR